MKEIIYVPQGFSANLITASSSCDIEGLYTDGFSTCNIIACIGKERIALIHADVQTNPFKIKQEIEWVGEQNELIIIIRENGKYLLNELKQFFDKEMPLTKILIENMDDQHDGVFVSFEQQKNNGIHPKIRKFPIGQRPQNLIHHPQEQRFLAVQKIEQVIGVRARVQTKKPRSKQHCIFDGRAWEAMEEWHFSVDTSQKLTKEEMDFFKKTDPYIILAGKMGGIVEEVKKSVPMLGELKEFVMPVAFYLEAYLNNYDQELLFNRNMTELLSNSQEIPDYKPVSSEDGKLKTQLLQLLQKEKIVFSEIAKIISEYKEAAPLTQFKENVLDEYRTFSRHYQERKYYKDLAFTYTEKLEKAKKNAEPAKKAYLDRNYSAAANLFLGILKDVMHCCTKAHPDLAATYYNLGRSLQQLGNFEEAKFFLNISLTYKKDCVEPKPLTADIEKTEKAVKECEQKIEEKTKAEQPKAALVL